MVDLETMKKLMPLVTTGGDVYRAQVVGYYDAEGPGARLEVVLDATQSPPVVKRRRELTQQGPGYSLDVLGAAVDDAAVSRVSTMGGSPRRARIVGRPRRNFLP